ncbi:MAG: hypothetical protein ACFB20_01490 [Opitutales bacterium]
MKIAAAFLLLALGASHAPLTADEPPAVRIGTYDNRIVALAYYRSAQHSAEIDERMNAYRQAEAAGNTAKVAELEAWFEQSQALAHRQTFARYPVHDLLLPVADQLPQVLVDQQVVAIVWQCHGQADNVEVVDVSLALAQLYEPNEKTLKIIKRIRRSDPVDLPIVDSHSHGHDHHHHH